MDAADEETWTAISLSPERYSAYLFHRASEYALAFRALDAGNRRDLTYPAYHLLFHALELALKAFLSSHGVSERDLRKRYSHGLEELLSEARRLGLDAASAVDDLVWHGDQMNGSSYALRYPAEILLSAPTPHECSDAIEQLLSSMKSRIESVALRAYLTSLGDRQ